MEDQKEIIFPENTQSMPCYLCIYGSQQQISLTKKGLDVLKTSAEIKSMKMLEGGVMIKLGELSEPLNIIKAKMSEASSEEINEMIKKSNSYHAQIEVSPTELYRCESTP